VINLYLNRYEEKIYNGEYGEILSKAIKIIVKIGESVGAKRLIKISHAHISGVGYNNIGEAGLSLLRDLASSGHRFSVFTTANPGSVDLDSHRYFPYSEDFLRKQLEILDHYKALGVETFTCAPYHIREPRYQEHLSWAESNAVIIANSVYGARTNKESGLTALFSALIGRTYYGGLHLKRERYPRIEIFIKNIDKDYVSIGLLGLYIGKISEDKIPVVKGLEKIEREKLKTFLAAFGTTSSQGMIYIPGVSREDYKESDYKRYIEDKIEIDSREIKIFYEEQENLCEDPEAFLIGCPHVSPDLILEIKSMLDKISGEAKKPLWLIIPPDYEKDPFIKNLLDKLREKGIIVLKGICPVISPLNEIGYKCIGTISSKAFFYMPRLAKVKISLMDLPTIISKAF